MISKFQRFSTLVYSALIAVAFTATACSPGMFFGDGKDTAVLNRKSYRRINTKCSGLDLSKSTIDVPTARKMVNCFNSNGGLEPIAKLVDSLPDSDLQALVDVGNRYVLNNNKLIFQLEATYGSLDRAGILEPTFTQFGRLLQNEEFIAAGIAILRQTVGDDEPMLRRIARRYLPLQPVPFHLDRDLLYALQELSNKITTDNVEYGLDIALTVASTPAFDSLQRRFRGPSPGQRDLRTQITDKVWSFIRENDRPEPKQIGTKLLGAVMEGSIFTALDEVTGKDEASLILNIPRLSSVMKATLANDGRIMDEMTSLFHYLHVPIKCMKKAETVDDGTMHVIRELSAKPTSEAASFIKRNNVLTLMALGPFCEFPPELQRYYGTMVDLAETNAIEPATDLLRAFYNVRRPGVDALTGKVVEKHPLAELLIDVLSYTGDGSWGSRQNQVGLKHLIPLMSEIQDRDAWDDALLLATLPNHESQRRLQEAAAELIAPRDSLRGRTIFEVLNEAIGRTSPDNLYNLVHSMGAYVEMEDSIALPALTALRKAYYINNVHPLIDIARDLTSEAVKNEAFFNTLFKIAEMKEFKDTIKFTSEMAIDGRLKELIGAVVTLFHKFAMEARTEVHPVVEPPFNPDDHRRHNLSVGRLRRFDLVRDPMSNMEACRQLDLGYSLADVTNGKFQTQMDALLACYDHEPPSNSDLVQAVGFLRAHYAEDGHNYLVHTIELTKKAGEFLKAPQIHALISRWLETLKVGASESMAPFYRALNALPFWVTQAVTPFGTSEAGPVLRPLFDLAKPLMEKARDNFERLEHFGAGVLTRGDFPLQLAYLHDLSDKKPEPTPAVLPLAQDRARIKRWITNRECWQLPRVEQRIDEIQHEYDHAVTSWDLDEKTDDPYMEWTLDRFKTKLEVLLKKFADPEQSRPDRKALGAFLNTLRYFSLEEGEKPDQNRHFTPKYLREWLQRRSTDHQLITYFYPGESRPRLRIVNSLDLLELVLINADFFAPFPINANMALKFLAMIGEAWGDEPREVWPDEIQRKFANRRPLTLKQAVDAIYYEANKWSKVLKFPGRPYCKGQDFPEDPVPDEPQPPYSWIPPLPIPSLPGMDVPMMRRSLYNIRVTRHVLDEALPGTGDGGLKVLRDLFFEFYYSTPPEHRHAGDSAPGKWRNNLAFVTSFVRLGMTRMIGRQMRLYTDGDPVLDDFLKALVQGSSVPEIRQLFAVLIDEDQDHDLIWNVMTQIFEIVDAGNGKYSAERLKELEGKTEAEAAAIKAEWTMEYRRMRQFAAYAMAAVTDLQKHARPGENSALIRNALKTIGAAVHSHRDYLTNNASVVRDMLRSELMPHFMRALYEDQSAESKERLLALLTEALESKGKDNSCFEKDDLSKPDTTNKLCDGLAVLRAIDEDPAASKSWDLFKDRYDVLKTLPAYQDLKLGDMTDDLLHFLENRQSSPFADEHEASEQLRLFLADAMTNGYLDQYLILAQNHPNEFYQLLEALSRRVSNGDMKDLFETIRRSLNR